MRAHVWLLHAALLLAAALNQTNTVFTVLSRGNENQDYWLLKEYANLASVSYCLKHGLEGGSNLGHQHVGCPSKACKYPAITNLYVADTFVFTDVFEVGAGFIALNHEKRTIYVVFRGTSTYTDWMTNLEALPSSYEPLVHQSDEFEDKLHIKCEDCLVFKGFNQILKTNGDVIIRKVARFMEEHPDYRVVVTGHSLGAALLVICGIELRLMGLNVLVVTFGGPKLGNENFAKFVNSVFDTKRAARHIYSHQTFGTLKNGFIRVVHRHDAVPLLPPYKTFFHSGFQYYLSAKGVEQTPETVEVRGINYIEGSDELGYRQMLPSGMSRRDHTSYFLPITLCKDRRAGASKDDI